MGRGQIRKPTYEDNPSIRTKQQMIAIRAALAPFHIFFFVYCTSAINREEDDFSGWGMTVRKLARVEIRDGGRLESGES
jgi:hypothetical protein